MKREYQAIVQAGFILQLDCPDLALGPPHAVRPPDAGASFARSPRCTWRCSTTRWPTSRPTGCACTSAGPAPAGRTTATCRSADIVDIVLKGRPTGLMVPGANPRHGHEWRVWKRRQAARRQDPDPRRDRHDHQLHRASRAGGRAHRALRARSSGARTSSPAATAASAPSPGGSRSTPTSCGTSSARWWRGRAWPRTRSGERPWSDDALLEVRDLRTYFYTRRGVVKAVDGATFSVRRGETLGIVGRVGLGQVDDVSVDPAARPRAGRPHRGRRASSSTAKTCWPRAPRRCGSCAARGSP